MYGCQGRKGERDELGDWTHHRPTKLEPLRQGRGQEI